MPLHLPATVVVAGCGLFHVQHGHGLVHDPLGFRDTGRAPLSFACALVVAPSGCLQRPLGLASLAPQRTPRPQAPPHPLRVGASCSTRLELWWEPRLGAVETMAEERGRRSWYSRGRGSRLGAGSSPTASAAPPHARAAAGPPACCAAAAPAPCRAPALLRLVRSSLQACTAPSFRVCPCMPHCSLVARPARRPAPCLCFPRPPKCVPAVARIRLGCTPRGGKEGACREGGSP